MPKKIEQTQIDAPLTRNPKHLTGEAKAKWNELLDRLPAEVLTHRHHDALTSYAETWAYYRDVVKQMEGQPLVIEGKTGALVQHPLNKLRIDAQKLLFSLGCKLGAMPNPTRAGYKAASPVGKFQGLVG